MDYLFSIHEERTVVIRSVMKFIYYTVLNVFVFLYFTAKKKRKFLMSQIFETIIVLVISGKVLASYIEATVHYYNAGDHRFAAFNVLRFYLVISDSLLWLMLTISFVQKIYNLILFIVLTLSGNVALLIQTGFYGTGVKTVIEGLLVIALFVYVERKKFKSFSETWKLKKSDIFYKNVLSFLPESILVVSEIGQITYKNGYLQKMFGYNVDNELGNFYSKFTQLKLRDCIEETEFQLFSIINMTSRLMNNPSTDRQLLIEGDSFKSQASEVTSLPGLVDFFKLNVNVWTTMGAHTLVFDTKYHHPVSKSVLSIEVKAFIFIEENEAQLTLIFRDTTDRDTIANLENENQTYKNNLIASFSHELRTPLNCNLGSLEQSMNHPDIPQDVKDSLLEPALISAKLLLYLVNDTLDYSQILNRSFQLNVKPGSVVQTVKECAALFEKRIVAKGLNLELCFGNKEEAELQDFWTDHQRLAQIVVNLLSNALKFTFEGTIKIILAKDHGKYRLTVRDTGIGMDEEIQASLSRNMEAAKVLDAKISHSSAGVGLGLMMASTFCQLLSCDNSQNLQFKSIKGKGSEFYFILSNSNLMKIQSAAQTEQSEMRKSAEFLLTVKSGNSPVGSEPSENEFLNSDIGSYKTIPFKNKLLKSKTHSEIELSNKKMTKEGEDSTVLLVDDEVFNLMILENYCKSLNLKTERAYNGKEVIEKMRELYAKGEKIEVVLMDMNMPVMDGYQTTLALRKMIAGGEINDLVIIGVTAYISKDRIDKCYECGVDEVVNKPLAQGDFNSLIKKYKLVSGEQ